MPRERTSYSYTNIPVRHIASGPAATGPRLCHPMRTETQTDPVTAHDVSGSDAHHADTKIHEQMRRHSQHRSSRTGRSGGSSENDNTSCFSLSFFGTNFTFLARRAIISTISHNDLLTVHTNTNTGTRSETSHNSSLTPACCAHLHTCVVCRIYLWECTPADCACVSVSPSLLRSSAASHATVQHTS